MRLYPGVSTQQIDDRAVRFALREIDTFLRDVSLALSPSQPATASSTGGAPTNASYITVVGETALSAERRLQVSGPITGSDGGANGAFTLGFSFVPPALAFGTAAAAGTANAGIRSDATLALFTATAPSPLAIAASAGASGFGARADHAHPYHTVRSQTSIQAGDTIANTTVATNFATTGGANAIPANGLAVGKVYRLTARGVYSTLGAVPGTLTLDVVAGTTVLASTGAQALSIGLVNDGWKIEADLIDITAGAGGTVEAQGVAVLQTGALAGNLIFMSNTATVGLDTTIAQALAVRVTWSVASASNTITMRQLIIEGGGA